jgi:hypothetical protein
MTYGQFVRWGRAEIDGSSILASSSDSVELTMGVSDGALERPPSRIFQAPNATTGQRVLSGNTV